MPRRARSSSRSKKAGRIRWQYKREHSKAKLTETAEGRLGPGQRRARRTRQWRDFLARDSAALEAAHAAGRDTKTLTTGRLGSKRTYTVTGLLGSHPSSNDHETHRNRAVRRLDPAPVAAVVVRPSPQRTPRTPAAGQQCLTQRMCVYGPRPRRSGTSSNVADSAGTMHADNALAAL